MTLPNLHPIFFDCCAKETTRYALTAPWLRDGYVYATNGHIIVRCPHTPAIGDVPDVDCNKPPCAELFTKRTWPVKLELGELPPPLAQVECKGCLGSGLSVRKCDECDGEGELECDLGHDHDCEECDGTGEIKGVGDGSCADCAGTVKVDAPPRPLRVSATQCLGEGYARLLVRHGAELCATERGGKDAIRFTVGGDCEGLVMPMQPGISVEASVDVRGGAEAGRLPVCHPPTQEEIKKMPISQARAVNGGKGGY